jgi:chorismate mutase
MQSIEELRCEIDRMDAELYLLVEKRIATSKKVQNLKKASALPRVAPAREAAILAKAPTVPCRKVMEAILVQCRGSL